MGLQKEVFGFMIENLLGLCIRGFDGFLKNV